MNNGNREFKSDVFSMLMQDPVNALEVYNVLNNSSLDDPGLVDICTLEKGISLSVRNDAAFIVDASLSIYEHQSTVCPNMPVRSLVYYTAITSKEIKNYNIYGSRLITIPEPQFVVFYNGDKDQPEQYELRLSDAFQKKTITPQIELICKVYNINSGKNEELLDKCKVLREYMIFVNYVKYFYAIQEYDELSEAINMAIDKCIAENVLAEFLSSNRDEVIKVTALDYTFDRQITLEREDARMEGREEGREERAKSIIENMLRKGMTPEDISDLTGIDIEYVKSIKESN